MNKLITGGIVTTGLVLLIFIANSYAQSTASERAAALKTWRVQCSEPDPDLQLAYLEEAISLKDESVLRVCLRQTLSSDNVDVRNLALRGVIASKKRLIFETEIPSKLQKEYDKAGNNKDELRQVEKKNIAKMYSTIENGFIFEIEDAELGSNHSTWFPIAGNHEVEENFKGDAYIRGTKINWTGRVIFNSWYKTCDFAVELSQTNRLEGTLKCEDEWPINVFASLP